MKVYEAVADLFVREGVTDVFGLMGDANMHWLNAMTDRAVRVYDVRHEGCALAMADGWARATGRPGVATTTSGPGVSQLATSLLAASRARTPLVVFAGETALGDEAAIQYLDQRRFAEATESGFVHLVNAEHVEDKVAKAFYQARTERRPVLLSAPIDVQKREDSATTPDLYTPSDVLAAVTDMAADPDLVAQAAQVVAQSRAVVVIAGRGARDSGADQAVLDLVTTSHGLLATTLQTKLYLRGQTEFDVGIAGLYGSKPAQQLLQQADCVIAVGASLNRYTTEYGYLFPDAHYVQIDSADHVVMGDGRRADSYLRGDARATLDALNSELAALNPKPGDYRSAETAELLREVWREPTEFVSEAGVMDPREAIVTLDHAVPSELPIVLGSGHQTDFGTMLLSRPRRIVSNYGMFGAIGQAPLLAMGWTVGTGNQPTLVVEGDASFIMHIAEFETACRYGWPLLVVVMNDEGLGAEFHKSEAAGLRADRSLIPSCDLGAVARAMGGHGYLVRDADSLTAAVASYLADPQPSVIDLRISREVLSIPYRRLLYAEDV